MGFSHIHNQDSFNRVLLPKVCILENSFHCGNGGQNISFNTRWRGEEPLIAQLGPALQSTGGHALLMTSFCSHNLLRFLIRICFGHLIRRADSLEKTLMLGKTEGRRKRGQQRTRCLDITDSMDMSLSNLQEMVKDRKAWQTEVHGVAKSQTWLSNWPTIVIYAVACIHCMSVQFQGSVTPASSLAHFFY